MSVPVAYYELRVHNYTHSYTSSIDPIPNIDGIRIETFCIRIEKGFLGVSIYGVTYLLTYLVGWLVAYIL
jgi:hypothetical protein